MPGKSSLIPSETGDNLNWSIEYYEANTDSCSAILENNESFEKVPLIKDSNIHRFKDGELVRYVGMVQEILNPEYYDVYDVDHARGNVSAKSGRYRDYVLCENLDNLMLNDKNLEERGVYFLIPIPHMSQWVEDYMNKEDEAAVDAFRESRKRPAPDSDEEDEEGNNDKFEPNPIQMENENMLAAMEMNYPLHKRTGLPCIAKFSNDKYGIVMNERIEVVGFLGLDPVTKYNKEKAPTTLLPRLHGIACRKLTHNNPLLSFNFNKSGIAAGAEKVRSDLHLVLSQILNDDPFAADYMICYLLSRVFTRISTGPVGHFSLNIRKIKEGIYPRCLFRLINSLVTNCHYIPLSVDTLNESEFRPKKNYDCNKLFSGRMQFSEGTYLMVDETVLNEGRLTHTGTMNFSALDTLVMSQVVDYNFAEYFIPFNADVPVLIVSDGAPLLKGKVSLSVTPFPDEESIQEAFDAADAFLQSQLEDVRKYLTCMRMMDFTISDELAARASDDFVNIRKADRSFSASDFDTLLTLARLMALSYGRSTLTLDDWLRAIEMEKERKLRQEPRR